MGQSAKEADASKKKHWGSLPNTSFTPFGSVNRDSPWNLHRSPAGPLKGHDDKTVLGMIRRHDAPMLAPPPS